MKESSVMRSRSSGRGAVEIVAEESSFQGTSPDIPPARGFVRFVLARRWYLKNEARAVSCGVFPKRLELAYEYFWAG